MKKLIAAICLMFVCGTASWSDGRVPVVKGTAQTDTCQLGSGINSCQITAPFVTNLQYVFCDTTVLFGSTDRDFTGRGQPVPAGTVLPVPLSIGRNTSDTVVVSKMFAGTDTVTVFVTFFRATETISERREE